MVVIMMMLMVVLVVTSPQATRGGSDSKRSLLPVTAVIGVLGFAAAYAIPLLTGKGGPPCEVLRMQLGTPFIHRYNDVSEVAPLAICVEQLTLPAPWGRPIAAERRCSRTIQSVMRCGG
jgi:hypothetical protein